MREAINVANALPGKDTIKFNIPAATDPRCDAGTGVCTIQPTSALPVITGPVLIDGYTQPGAAPATATTNADLKIVLDGSQAGDGVDGLVLVTDDSTVKGLVIHGFRVYDISNYGYVQGNSIVIIGDSTIGGGDNNTIVGTFIGTDVTGTACVGNGGSGVLIGGPYSTDDTDNNTIGGTDLADRNVIACNGFQRDTSTPDPDDGTATGGDGVTIRANLKDSTFYSADGNQVLGNYIGTDVTGAITLTAGTQTFTFDSQTFDMTYIGNTGNGVRIASGQANTVGGTDAGERNIISGNELAGVRIEAVAFDHPPTLTRAANNNVVQGNYIGTDLNGTADLGNLDVGVYIIGFVDDADSNQIGGTTGTTPGGSCTGACNLISGSDGSGLMILGGEAHHNVVEGNYVGTDLNGTVAIPNDAGGIVIADAEDNTIGGTTPEERNLISGNGGYGIAIVNSAETWNPDWELFAGIGEVSGNAVEGSYIGTDVNGTAAVPNQRAGVVIAAPDNTVGGATAAQGNVISSNAREGVAILGAGATGNSVRNNLIGTQADGASPLGNGSHGVLLVGDPSDNDIGAGSVGNTIAYNSGDGVVAFSGTGNQILDNSIFDNTELGIDLGDDNAVIPNDDTDPDAGANNLQNYPVLASASIIAGPSTLIQGVLNSTPNTQFTIQFFANTACDASGFGEGRAFLVEDTTTTDGSGNATTSVAVVGDLTEQFITAMATDPYGNTSEFSNCLPVPSQVQDTTTPVLTIDKQGQDLNGGRVEPGDTLRYTINYAKHRRCTGHRSVHHRRLQRLMRQHQWCDDRC